MKLFQCMSSSGFRHLVGFSLKTLTRDLPFSNYAAKKMFVGFPTSFYMNITKFHTTCLTRTAIENLTVTPKKRLQKKKTQKLKVDLKGKTSSAVAYTSAEAYKMQDLIKKIANHNLYQCVPLPEDVMNDLHVCVKDDSSQPPSHIYIFSEGSVVFWNVSESKRKEMLSFLKPFEINSYEDDLIDAEKEDLDYTYSEEATGFYDGVVLLNSNTATDLHIYTFSNSLSQSVKLGMLEAALEKYSDSIEWVTEKMKKGEKIKMSRSELFAKRGELFSLRHAINLSSDFLDSPDFYWDRKDLEILYQKTCNYLDIPLRTRTMNVRLNYCSELVDLLVNHMNDEHHVRLEWMIIILIMVEVVFECVHFLERFAH